MKRKQQRRWRARQQFYDSRAGLKEWRKRRGCGCPCACMPRMCMCVCVYDEKARGREREFHSISRPLTIERVRSAVCTQDIFSERSSVGGPVECTEKTLHTVPCTPVVARRAPFPRRASFFPRFLPDDPPRRKGFSITFRRRFCSALFALEPTFACGSPLSLVCLGEKLTSTSILYLSIVCECLSFAAAPAYFSDFFGASSFFASFFPSVYERPRLHSSEMYSWRSRGSRRGLSNLWRR